MNKLIVIRTDPACHAYINALETIFEYESYSRNNETIVVDNYKESLYQIFGCLDHNVYAFSEMLSYKPEKNLLVRGDLLTDEKYDFLRTKFIDLAFLIYFKLLEKNILTKTTCVSLIEIHKDFVLVVQEDIQ